MQTLILNVDSNININMLIAHINMLKGVNSVSISNEDMWKEDIEAWKDWSDADETNYLKSIPGFMEKLDAELNDPNTEWFPIEEVIPEWGKNV